LVPIVFELNPKIEKGVYAVGLEKPTPRCNDSDNKQHHLFDAAEVTSVADHVEER